MGMHHNMDARAVLTGPTVTPKVHSLERAAFERRLTRVPGSLSHRRFRVDMSNEQPAPVQLHFPLLKRDNVSMIPLSQSLSTSHLKQEQQSLEPIINPIKQEKEAVVHEYQYQQEKKSGQEITTQYLEPRLYKKQYLFRIGDPKCS